ncbi:hypothetical protein WDW37_06140 [Bdellovibrionota bacterium FG-1]
MYQFKKWMGLSLLGLWITGQAVAGVGGGGRSFSVTWDEFQRRCADADSFDNQRAPKEIKLQCTNVEREFVPDAPGVMDLALGRHVFTTVLSDKFNVVSMERGFAVATRPSTCLRYKEIEKTITIERPLTCQEVLSIKGEVADFCTSALDMAKHSNPKLIDVHETGVRTDNCGPDTGGKK